MVRSLLCIKHSARLVQFTSNRLQLCPDRRGCATLLRYFDNRFVIKSFLSLLCNENVIGRENCGRQKLAGSLIFQLWWKWYKLIFANDYFRRDVFTEEYREIYIVKIVIRADLARFQKICAEQKKLFYMIWIRLRL